MGRVRLSMLDLAPIGRGESVGHTIAASVALAQQAEEAGYQRVWYAEHHNIASIASSATSVLIAHVGAQTSTVRLGAGGVMLPNHAPLVIAEQYGTLAAMYPGRIDLGLGRAPGSDGATMLALRRHPRAADRFPEDVLELQGYLSGHSRVPGVDAIPGRDARVPLYLLGSSLFGAKLAAVLGLPYAFASHFAPSDLGPALDVYRREFRPSEQLDRPYVMAGINVVVADTATSAREQLHQIRRTRAVNLHARRLGLDERSITDAQADQLLDAGASAQVDHMLTYTAAGTARQVREYLGDFVALTGADELVTVQASRAVEDRLRSVVLLSEAMTEAPSAPATGAGGRG